MQANGKVYTKEITGAASPVRMSGKTLTIHCAAYADYNTSDALQNGTALDALAQLISDDFYGWGAKRYDFTFKEIQPWDLCGYDDSVTWTFGRPVEACEFSAHGKVADDAVTVHGRRGIEYLAQTRVQSLPANFWAEVNGCSDSTKEIVEPHMMAKADADIAAGAEGTVSLYDSFTNDTTKNVTARNISGVEWSQDKRGSAEGIGDAVWIGVPAECPV